MRCIYCYGDGGEYAGKGVMSRETAWAAVDWLLVNSAAAPKVEYHRLRRRAAPQLPLAAGGSLLR